MGASFLSIPAVRAVLLSTVLVSLTGSSVALGARAPLRSRPPVTPVGSLVQLHGASGCLVDGSAPRPHCARVRALRGPAPFLGSSALALSPDGRNVYVASSNSNAIAVFRRDARTGTLTQRRGAAGCISDGGGSGCAKAIGLRGPNSVAVSADGNNVYATAFGSNALLVFRRNRSTGQLTQLGPGSGCLTNTATPGCSTVRALGGPDVVRVSPDDHSVYVGAFTGSAIAVFARSGSTGALTQPAGVGGCVVETPTSGCTSGLALSAPEGMAVSADGKNVYVAAALSNALDVLTRNRSTGALTQATNGTGCIVESALPGCTTGVQLEGPNAVAISGNDRSVYVTSLFSNSVTSFSRTSSTGHLAQLSGTQACVIYVLAVGCSLGRTLSDPEGLAVSPDGANVYAAVFVSGAIDVLNRNTSSGALIQKPRRPGCVVVQATPDCTLGRGLSGASSIAVSPDGRYVYAAAFASNSVAVFKRVTKPAKPKRVPGPPPVGLG